MSRDPSLARMGGDDTLCVDCGQPSFAAPAGRCYACAQKETGPEVSQGAGEPQSYAAIEPFQTRLEHSRIPPEALAAVERVLAFRAAAVSEVPGQERWRSTNPYHQAHKCEGHAAECLAGVESDHETGEHPLAHAAARALLGLALALRTKP